MHQARLAFLSGLVWWDRCNKSYGCNQVRLMPSAKRSGCCPTICQINKVMAISNLHINDDIAVTLVVLLVPYDFLGRLSRCPRDFLYDCTIWSTSPGVSFSTVSMG